MTEQKKDIVYFHFGKEDSTSVKVDSADDLIDGVLDKKSGWIGYDGKLINLDNVTYISYRKADEPRARVVPRPF